MNMRVIITITSAKVMTFKHIDCIKMCLLSKTHFLLTYIKKRRLAYFSETIFSTLYVRTVHICIGDKRVGVFL